MKEIWKNIKGYEGLYQVSNLGNVKSVDRYVYSVVGEKKRKLVKGKDLKLQIDRGGYIYVHLSKNGVGKNKKVHRLACEAFCRKRPGANNVNHKDGDKTNNKAVNLEWASHKENVMHAYGSGLSVTARQIRALTFSSTR